MLSPSWRWLQRGEERDQVVHLLQLQVIENLVAIVTAASSENVAERRGATVVK
jgi:hypothetical protein